MNKERFIRPVAVVLVLWYLVSIIGLNVHCCSHTGESVVLTGLSDAGCAAVHAEHGCGTACLHAFSAPQENRIPQENRVPQKNRISQENRISDECCSNDFHVLDLTGDTASGQYSSFISQLLLQEGCPSPGCFLPLPREAAGHFPAVRHFSDGSAAPDFPVLFRSLLI